MKKKHLTNLSSPDQCLSTFMTSESEVKVIPTGCLAGRPMPDAGGLEWCFDDSSFSLTFKASCFGSIINPVFSTGKVQ